MMHRPAYAPEFFQGQMIKFAIPYAMTGEILLGPNLTAQQFPDAVFRLAIDKPFEIWRMKPAVTPFDGANPQSARMLDVVVPTLSKRVRLSIMDTSKNERLTMNPTLISSFVKDNEQTWEWDPRPYTIVRQEGFQVSVDTLAFPTVCEIPPDADTCEPVPTPVGGVRVEVTFEGYLLVVEPPSQNR